MSLDRPRFRRDLEAVPLEADGQRYVDVRDPITGVSFRLYDFEYHVALAFDGLTFDKIIPWLKLAAGISVEPSQLRDFAAQLEALGFLEREESEPRAVPGAGPAEAMAAAGSAPPPPGSPVRTEPAPEPALATVAFGPVEPRDEASAPTGADVPASTPAPAGEASPPLGPAPVTAEVVPGEAVPQIEEIAKAGGEIEPQGAELVAPPEVAPAAAETAVSRESQAAAPEEPAALADAPAIPDDAQAAPQGAPAIPDDAQGAPQGAPAMPEDAQPAPEDAPAMPEGAQAAPQEPAALADAPAVPARAYPAYDPFADRVEAGSAAEEGSGEVAPEATATPFAVAVEPAPAPDWAEQTTTAPEETYGVPEAIFTPSMAPAETAGPAGETRVEPGEAARPADDMAAKPSPAETFAAAAWVSAAWMPAAGRPGPAAEDEVAPRPNATSEEGGAAPEAQIAPGAPPFAARPHDVPAPGPARYLDSTAFPVLPTPPPVSVEPRLPAHVTPVVVVPFAVTPPPRVLPPPYVTPSPSTLGPLPLAVRRRQRRSFLLFGSLGVLAAAALLAIVLPFFFPPHEPPPTSVRTLTVVPGPIVRYFTNTGTVAPLPGPVLKFPAPGKVLKVAKPGTMAVAGDVLAALEAARALLGQLAQQRERLAFHQQMAEGMRQAGNRIEEERQTAKVEERKARIAKTMQALAQVAVLAGSAGTVDESFARDGDSVEAGSLAVRLSPSGHRATFDLPSAQAAEARRLGFCQVGVDGHLLDCTPTPDRPEDGRLSVDIAALPAALVGRPARLARARWGGAVALPAAAIQRAGRRPQVLVVAASGRVEVRPVTVAEQSATEAIVIQGLDAGDSVIIAPPPNLRPGTAVAPHS